MNHTFFSSITYHKSHLLGNIHNTLGFCVSQLLVLGHVFHLSHCQPDVSKLLILRQVLLTASSTKCVKIINLGSHVCLLRCQPDVSQLLILGHVSLIASPTRCVKIINLGTFVLFTTP